MEEWRTSVAAWIKEMARVIAMFPVGTVVKQISVFPDRPNVVLADILWEQRKEFVGLQKIRENIKKKTKKGVKKNVNRKQGKRPGKTLRKSK